MSKLSGILVFIQFSCLFYFVFFTDVFAEGLFLVMQVTGLLMAIWGVLVMRVGNFNIQPEVKPKASLVMKGPYKLIRNPMYSGLLLFFGAGMFDTFQIDALLTFIVFFIVLLLKIKLEEKHLEQKFGAAYLSYKKDTYRLIPYIY